MALAEAPVVVLVNCTSRGGQPPVLSTVKLAVTCAWAQQNKAWKKNSRAKILAMNAVVLIGRNDWYAAYQSAKIIYLFVLL